MRVVVTGTPGTGKTTATDRLAPAWADGTAADDDRDLVVHHLNEAIDDERLYTEVDEDRDSVVADLDAVAAWVDEHAPRDADGGDGDDAVHVVESHLAHHVDADRVVVLRCHPETIEARLAERGESEASARENAESEALDVVLAEAVDRHGMDGVYEIDTTDRDPDEVGAEIAAVVRGERDPSAGTVDFTDYL